jgi:tryptophanyl-tRNA synthetase
MYKAVVTEIVVEKLRPISETIRRLQADRSHLEHVLEAGAQRAEAIAEETMKEVRDALGLRTSELVSRQKVDASL